MAEVHTDNRGIIDVIKELREESSALLQQEVALAKTEMSEKASRVVRNVAYLLAGALVLLLGLIFVLRAVSEGITLALIFAELERLAPWLGPLIVGLVTSMIGVVLVQKARSSLKEESLVPEKSVRSLKEDQQWLKHKAT
jgi:hypothetical protein